MDITVTSEALKWFKKELELNSGDHVQFFVRYGGCGDFQTGFSIGVTVKDPEGEVISIEKDGILFYVEKKDEWYFDGQDFSVSFDDEKQEISFGHKE